MPQCGKCSSCINPNTNCCLKTHISVAQNVMPDKTTRFSCKGKVVYHFLWTSTFSEYTVVPIDAVAKIDDRAPLDKACLFGCGFPTGYGAAVNTAKVTPSSTCAIFGLGAIGLSAIIGCKLSGALRIIAIDINSSKFEKAMAFGATECINPKDYSKPIEEVIMEMTGLGVHYSFECIGKTDVMRAALECTHMGYGTSVIIGDAPPDAHITFDPYLLFTGRTWKGSIFGGWKSKDHIPRLVSDYLSHKFNLDGLVSHTLPFHRINEGFHLLQSGQRQTETLSATVTSRKTVPLSSSQHSHSAVEMTSGLARWMIAQPTCLRTARSLHSCFSAATAPEHSYNLDVLN
ncbi:alcohol dehydrogenase 1-like isoform X4 [Hyla sarda]|nr:alcohol dehydrogenase 1-like isoform X4 [Hyla sarda]